MTLCPESRNMQYKPFDVPDVHLPTFAVRCRAAARVVALLVVFFTPDPLQY